MQAVIGICRCAAALSLLLKQYRPEYSLFLSLACGIGILLWLLDSMMPILEQVKQFSSLASFGTQQGAGSILIKSLGICLVTQAACDICRDIGENAIAARLETAGKAAMILLAGPMLTELLQQAIHLIG